MGMKKTSEHYIDRIIKGLIRSLKILRDFHVTGKEKSKEFKEGYTKAITDLEKITKIRSEGDRNEKKENNKRT